MQGRTARGGPLGGTALRETDTVEYRLAAPTVGILAADQVTRRRLELLLARIGCVARPVTASLDELVALARDCIPDVVVVSIELSLLERTSPLVLLRIELPASPIIVVSPGDRHHAVRKALRAGADGFVREVEVERTLPVTIAAVTRGQVCVPEESRHQVLRPAFSFRERQVLELLTRGLTNGEIANRLYLSESTVKSHLSSSFRKLGVSSRAETARLVLDPDSGVDLGAVVPAEDSPLVSTLS
jgi:DNA-binding NarL/FixJ family response regulator